MQLLFDRIKINEMQYRAPGYSSLNDFFEQAWKTQNPRVLFTLLSCNPHEYNKKAVLENLKRHLNNNRINYFSQCVIGTLKMIPLFKDTPLTIDHARTLLEIINFNSWEKLFALDLTYPIHALIKENLGTIVPMVLKYKFELINQQDQNGDTPLHLAVRSENPTLVKGLLKCGANKLIANNHGIFPEAEALLSSPEIKSLFTQ